jgi:UDP-N-acetylmuramate dehydrogenase
MEESTEPLSRYTTLKIGGSAHKLYQPTTEDELVETILKLNQKNEPWHILGGGSNMLISSQGVEGSVIRTAQMTQVEQLEKDLLDAGAGARLPHLARFAAMRGLSGLEFAVGIPGTVGGGVIMNAGAHGSCMADIVESVRVLDTSKSEILTLSQAELDFKYRKCNLDPAKHVVISARLKMKIDGPEKIEERIRANEEYRVRTQPLGWPNAGSTFKNPEPTRGAGMLLDQAGAKNLTIGHAAVSALHANFVINLGGATSQEVASLLKRMQEVVQNSFQVRLQPEWKTLGKFTDSEREIWSS